MSAQQDRDVAERVMGWTLQGQRWLDASGQDTGFRITTWKPSEDATMAGTVLKRLVAANRTARTEDNGSMAQAVLFDQKLEGVTDLGEPINVGLEAKRATAGTVHAAICAMALS